MKLEIKVCSGTNCISSGNYEILHQLERIPGLSEYCNVVACKCTEHCDDGRLSPVVLVGEKVIVRATLQAILEELNNALGTSLGEQVS